jgi:ADP-ribosylglycohydrolase
VKTLTEPTTVDMSSIGTSIVAAFNGNLDTIALVAGVMIGASVVFRWIKRASK